MRHHIPHYHGHLNRRAPAKASFPEQRQQAHTTYDGDAA